MDNEIIKFVENNPNCTLAMIGEGTGLGEIELHKRLVNLAVTQKIRSFVEPLNDGCKIIKYTTWKEIMKLSNLFITALIAVLSFTLGMILAYDRLIEPVNSAYLTLNVMALFILFWQVRKWKPAIYAMEQA